MLLCSARSSCIYCQTTRGCHGGPQRQGQGNWSECLFLISTRFNLIRFYLELLVAFEFTPVLTVPVSPAGVSRAGRLPKTLWTSAPGPGRAAPALQRLSGHPAEPHLAAETMSSRWSLPTAAPLSNSAFIYVAVSVFVDDALLLHPQQMRAVPPLLSSQVCPRHLRSVPVPSRSKVSAEEAACC